MLGVRSIDKGKVETKKEKRRLEKKSSSLLHNSHIFLCVVKYVYYARVEGTGIDTNKFKTWFL